jgi:hypothetical protein
MTAFEGEVSGPPGSRRSTAQSFFVIGRFTLLKLSRPFLRVGRRKVIIIRNLDVGHAGISPRLRVEGGTVDQLLDLVLDTRNCKGKQ